MVDSNRQTSLLYTYEVNHFGMAKALKHVSFIRIDEGTVEDYAFLNALEDEFVVALPNRLLASLASLKDSLAGYQINRLEQSIQYRPRVPKLMGPILN
jgi:hypothetical protein